MMPTLLEELTAATAGMEWMSETDAPVDPLVWPEPTPLDSATLLGRLKLPLDTPVEQLELERFFAPATTIRDWFGAEERARAQRFTALMRLLRERLRDVQVFKIGTIDRQVYALGYSPDGSLAGVQTRVVET